MNSPSKGIPFIPRIILQIFLFSNLEEAYLGDLNEEYSGIVSEHGKFRAFRWIWSLALKSIPGGTYGNLIWSMAMFNNYMKIAWRNLFRNKTQNLLNILGLSVGMAAFILIALYIQYELSYDTYHENADRIYHVVKTRSVVTPPPLAPAMMNGLPEVEAATRVVDADNVFIKTDRGIFSEGGWVWTDKHIFDVFSYPLISGDKKTALDVPNALVISEDIAQKYFRNENPLGKTLATTMDKEFTVTGVMKNIPANSYVKGDFFARIETLTDFGANIEDWSNNYCNAFVLVKKDCNIPEFVEKYSEYVKTVNDSRFDYTFNLLKLTDLHLRSSHLVFHFSPVSNILSIYIFSATALFILLIAVINFMNLSTARSNRRAKEVGLRKVIGAQRPQLIRQFLSESIVLSFLSMIFAVMITYMTLPFFNNLVDREITIDIFGNASFFSGLLAAFVLIGLLSGSYPALVMSNFSIFSTLKGHSSGNSKGGLFRNILVVVQFSCSILLIICTIIVSNQLNYVRNTNIGFNKDRILVVPLSDDTVSEKRDAIRAELLKNSNIAGVTFSTKTPMNISWHNSFRYEDKDDSENNRVHSHYANVDYDYVDLFGLEIVKGRNFDRTLDEGKYVYIINEFIVDKIGWEDPIGKEYTNRDEPGTVVGVVKNFHNENMHIPIEAVTLCLRPDRGEIMSVKCGPGDIQASVAAVEKVWNTFSDGIPFEFEFMDERYDNMYRSEIRIREFFNYFSLLAIIICCLGLFGLAAFTVEQRTKEIGIRKVLGASVPKIIRMLSWQFTKWVLIANFIAWPAAWFAMKTWLEDFAYKTEIGLSVFLSAALIAVIISFLTVLHQSLKASLANPVKSLKYE